MDTTKTLRMASKDAPLLWLSGRGAMIQMYRKRRKLRSNAYIPRVAKKKRETSMPLPPIKFTIRCGAPMLVAGQSSRQCTNKFISETKNMIFATRQARASGWMFVGPGAEWWCPFHSKMQERQIREAVMGVPRG